MHWPQTFDLTLALIGGLIVVISVIPAYRYESRRWFTLTFIGAGMMVISAFGELRVLELWAVIKLINDARKSWNEEF